MSLRPILGKIHYPIPDMFFDNVLTKEYAYKLQMALMVFNANIHCWNVRKFLGKRFSSKNDCLNIIVARVHFSCVAMFGMRVCDTMFLAISRADLFQLLFSLRFQVAFLEKDDIGRL